MSIGQRSVIIGSAALAVFFAASLVATPAHARHRFWWLRGRIHTPHVHVEVQTQPAYPAYPTYYPPAAYAVPAPVPAPCCYGPAPVVVHSAPPRPHAQVGLAISGQAHSPVSGQLPVGGVVGALQFRTSSHSLLALELQSMGARRPSDGTRRDEVAGLLAGRVFFWNASLAPYFELAGGLGHTSIESPAMNVEASQLLGRYGLGLELRMGRHLVLEGQIAQVHKLRLGLDDPGDPGYVPVIGLDDDRDVRKHERAVEFRAGLGFRF
jgi:hypothetical protein